MTTKKHAHNQKTKNKKQKTKNKKQKTAEYVGQSALAALLLLSGAWFSGGANLLLAAFVLLKLLVAREDRCDPGDAFAFSAMVEAEDGLSIAERQSFWRGGYADHVAFDPERGRREWQARRGLIETSWGYAITCHKAQGSQFPTVVVVDDGFGRSAADRSRWLYTAITRAEWGLVILA